MIKVYKCRAQINTPYLTSNSRSGFFKKGEDFLMYRSSKGTLVVSSPKNSTMHTNAIPIKHAFDTKRSWLLDLNITSIVNIFEAPNKTHLRHSFALFKYPSFANFVNIENFELNLKGEQ